MIGSAGRAQHTAYDLEAVDPGQAEIEQEEVERAVRTRATPHPRR